MAIERGAGGWHGLRPALARLQWGTGLTRAAMMNQSAELRTPVMELLPSDFIFPDDGAVISYFEMLEGEGHLELAVTEPPQGYTDRSTTGLTVSGHEYQPSVGGGYGSGNTGSSAQTGANRRGILHPDD